MYLQTIQALLCNDEEYAATQQAIEHEIGVLNSEVKDAYASALRFVWKNCNSLEAQWSGAYSATIAVCALRISPDGFYVMFDQPGVNEPKKLASNMEVFRVLLAQALSADGFVDALRRAVLEGTGVRFGTLVHGKVERESPPHLSCGGFAEPAGLA